MKGLHLHSRKLLGKIKKTMTTEHLSLWVAFVALVISFIALVVAIRTLRYMHHRDVEVDTRTAWTEVHSAMSNLRGQRAALMSVGNTRGAYSSNFPNPFVEHKREYDLAFTQLRGQLDRMNDDPLASEVKKFLDGNKDRWETDDYENQFDALFKEVASKSRL